MLKANQWAEVWIFSLLLLASGAIHAQTACPPGLIPYGAGVCGPDQGQNQGSQRQMPMLPPVKWADEWGAIAVYIPEGVANPKGVLGTAILQPSESAARQAALQDCRSNGGLDCKIDTTYYNACIAMIVGHPAYNIADGRTQDAAVGKGMKICADTGNVNCHVYYSACSLPQVVQ
jgi:hypothetical protein